MVLGGSGRQGRAIVNSLKILDPRCEIHSVDTADLTEEVEKREGVYHDCHYPIDAIHSIPADVVISALPYPLNATLGRRAIEKGRRWVDLGGHTQTTSSLEKFAKESGRTPIATDQGLAPGLMNILAWKVLCEVGPAHTLRLLCGGLPVQEPSNFLKYYITFSPIGLVNEYLNSIHGLLGGSITRLANLSPTLPVRWEGRTFEAFATSGGAPLAFLEEMKEAGVDTCVYETLRYRGHAAAIKFLSDSGLRRDEIARAIQNACYFGGLELTDRIFLGIEAYRPGEFSASTTTYRWEIRMVPDGMSAMQKGTGCTAAVVADLMASGALDQHKVVRYRNISALPDFYSKLTMLGVLTSIPVEQDKIYDVRH